MVRVTQSKRDLLLPDVKGAPGQPPPNPSTAGIPSKFQAQQQLKDLLLEIKQKESQLTALKAEIKSHQRLQSQLGDSEKQDSAARFDHEVSIRDKQISILHDRLIVLDAELRAGKATEFTMRDVQKEAQAAEMMLKMRVELEGKIEKMRGDAAAERKRWIDERKVFVEMQETLNSEVDKLKSCVSEREKQLFDNSMENTRLAQEIQEKHLFNSELQQKVASLNDYIQDLTHKLLEEQESSGKTSHLEQSLSSANATIAALDAEIVKLRSDISKLQSDNETLERVANQERRNIADVQETLQLQVQKVSELQDKLRSTESEFAKQLQDVKTSLEASIEGLRQVWEKLHTKELEEQEARVRKAEDAIRTLRNSLHAKEGERIEQERLVAQAIAQQTVLKSRIKDLESFIEQQKVRNAEQSQREEIRVKGLMDEVELTKKRVNKLVGELSEKDLAVGRAQNQSVALLSKIEEAKTALEEATQKLQRSESSLKDVQSQLSLLQHEKSECDKQSTSKDMKLKQLFSRVKSLEDEISVKDADNLKRESANLKYITQVEELKKALQSAHAKLRTAAADQLAEMNLILGKKDSEIALLKEMVRSAKIQMKGELSRAKKKPTVSDPPPQLYPKPPNSASMPQITEEPEGKEF